MKNGESIHQCDFLEPMTFGTAGTSTTGWVWVNEPIIIGGTSVTISLPRLAWEFLN